MTGEEPDDFELDDRLRLARQDVPWQRSGYPGAAHQGGEEWGPYVLNMGIAPWRNRLKNNGWIKALNDPSTARSYLRERAFAELWDYENNNDDCILDKIIGIDALRQIRPEDHTRYLMELTAQAVIQWLGTSCGQSFIFEAERIRERNLERLYPEDAERRREQEERWRERDKQIREQAIIEKEKARIASEAREKINMLVETEKRRALEKVEMEMQARVQAQAFALHSEWREVQMTMEVKDLVQRTLLDREEAARQEAERMERESPLGGRRIIEVEA